MDIAKKKKEEVIGRKFTDVFKDSEIPYLDIYERVAKTRQPYQFETYSPRIDRHFVVSVISPMENHIATITTDITKRKVAEVSQKVFSDAVGNSTDAIGMSTPDGIHYYQNKAFDELFGEIGMNPPDTLYVDKNIGHEVFETIMSGGEWSGEVQMYDKNGRIVDILLRAYSNKDEKGNIISLLGMHTDITARKQMEERVRRADKMEAIGQLAGGVAHDFNNQLGGIMGLAELMLGQVDDEKRKAYAARILSTATRAAELTGQLLAFARKGQYQSKIVDIHAIIHEVVEILSHSIDKKIEIVQNLSANPSYTSGDPNQLQNALLNLSLNARDAMPDGGCLEFETLIRELDIEFCHNCTSEIKPGMYLQINVKDTGCGIPDVIIEHIFEPFYTTKEIGKGTGMGLASVYGTVKQHNGLINVKSAAGKGTIFSIFLPLQKDKPQAECKEKNSVDVPHNFRVLVIDDEDIIRVTAEDMLTCLGCNVTTFAEGKLALEYYRKNWSDIDLVILDMILPKMSGSEIYAAMKKANPEVRVLLASGYSINGAAQKLLAAGVNGFIQKPFRIAQLSAKIREILQ